MFLHEALKTCAITAHPVTHESGNYRVRFSSHDWCLRCEYRTVRGDFAPAMPSGVNQWPTDGWKK